MTAQELLDRWIEALQILAGDDDNPGAEGRERMRAERAQFMARYDTERRAEVLNEAVALVALHVDLGAPKERILTELRRLAAAPQPDTTKEQS